MIAATELLSDWPDLCCTIGAIWHFVCKFAVIFHFHSEDTPSTLFDCSDVKFTIFPPQVLSLFL